MASQRRLLSRHGGANNYPPVEREIMITCPYNAAHIVPASDFKDHLDYCYQIHCVQQENKKEKPLFSICKHDPSHHVRNEDLEDHERACGWNRTLNAMYGQGQYEIDGVTYSRGGVCGYGSDCQERRKGPYGYEYESDSGTPDK